MSSLPLGYCRSCNSVVHNLVWFPDQYNCNWCLTLYSTNEIRDWRAAWRFNTANITAHKWTRPWAQSVPLTSQLHILSILMLSPISFLVFHTDVPKRLPLKFKMFSLSPSSQPPRSNFLTMQNYLCNPWNSLYITLSFISLGSKYFPNHLFLKYAPFMFFPQSNRPHHTHTKLEIIVLYILLICLLDRRQAHNCQTE